MSRVTLTCRRRTPTVGEAVQIEPVDEAVAVEVGHHGLRSTSSLTSVVVRTRLSCGVHRGRPSKKLKSPPLAPQ